MIPMYEGVNNSPETVLTADISASATTISLASSATLPAAPNLATIGEGEDAEVVLYEGKSGTSLTSVTRGYGGTTAKSWAKNEIVARCYTKYDHDTFISNIRELQEDVKRYGVRFTGSASKGTRLYEAVGLTAAVGTDEEDAYNDFDYVEPWAGMRRCNTAIINGERVPTYFEGEAGYSNTDADVYVYVPKFYYHKTEDDSETIVTTSPLRGYITPKKFKRADGTERDYCFLSAYHAGTENGVPVSRSGYFAHAVSLNAFMSLCSSSHESQTLDSDIWIQGTADDEILTILLDVEFATRDHQTIMYGAANMRCENDTAAAGGTNGFTLAPATAAKYIVGQTIAIGTAAKGSEVSDHCVITAIDPETGEISFTPPGEDITVEAGNYISSRPWKSGACDRVLSSSGSPTSNSGGAHPCVYRGIENPWGNLWRWRWDFLKNNDQPYILDAPENYSASIDAHHTALSYKMAAKNGYATEMGYDQNFPHVRLTKSVSGGSATTYYADYYYYTSGVRALRVGGGVSDTRYAGARYFHVSHAPSSSSWHVGASLSPA